MAMIPFLSELHQLTLRLEADPAWQDQRFEPPGISMNIGINDHTMALNITPAQSVCTFHCRPMPDQPVHDLLQVIEQAAEKHGLQYVLHGNDGALWTDPDAPFIRALEEISGTRSRTVAYGTDGCQFEELAQLAVLGPGCITQAHTDDEWISRQQLAAGADLYERLIRHWCCP